MEASKNIALEKKSFEFSRFLLGIAESSVEKILQGLRGGQLKLEKRYGESQIAVYGEKDHELSAAIVVHDPETFRFITSGGSVGAGEAYVLGLWTTPDLPRLIQLFSRNLSLLEGLEEGVSPLKKFARSLFNIASRNTLKGARKNIAAHYDLGNDFFETFLDPTLTYSSGIFPSKDSTMEDASYNKIRTACEKLKLCPDDHLVEIGTGWGTLAIYAATNYGCRVTTTTISEEQHAHAEQRIKALGLEDRITLLKEDYRNLEGQYDKLVSIEMIEAVGHQYLGEFFAKCSSLLKPEGLMVLQAITIADQRYDDYYNSTDFIKRYIFPGGCLPSINRISEQVVAKTDLQMVQLNDITAHYAETLKHWRKTFLEQSRKILSQGFDDKFLRMWDYYFSYCEGGFRERVISTSQITLAKPGYRFESVQ